LTPPRLTQFFLLNSPLLLHNCRVKLIIAITGASGSIYAQRLLDNLDARAHEIHLICSEHARTVIAEELGKLAVAPPVIQHADDRSMHVPFVSGSAKFDAMVVIPCSMGTLGRIAQGASDSTITRAADVFLKERRKLILVPRESPINLLHARNLTTLLEAGATVIPACPSFYSRPQTIPQLVDTITARVLDHLGIEHQLHCRWEG
jgi:4-hydroxy-3-polyprenylbenzoate decarboxylase